MLHTAVVDLDGEVVGDVVADGGDGGVVVRTTPFDCRLPHTRLAIAQAYLALVSLLVRLPKRLGNR